MSRSKHAVELCALLVDETYGELTSRIFTILLRRGRLSVQMLSKHTRLSPRHVRHGLAVLIQQNLVYFHHENDISTTFYEANHDAAYGLVRSGKIMEIIESRHGSVAKDMAENIFQLGHSNVSKLIETYHVASEQSIEGNGYGMNGANGTTGNGVNGHDQHAMLPGQLHAILIQMLESGLIEVVREHMFRSPTDTQAMLEREILASDYEGNTKGNKQKDELKVKIRERLQQLRDDGSQDWKPKAGKKRALNGDGSHGSNGTGKRRRLSNGAVNGGHSYEDDGVRLDANLTLRINYEKCTVALRNQRLVELASERIGDTTAQIYETLLRLLERKIPRCRANSAIDDTGDQGEGPSITTMEVAASLSQSVDPGNGIGKVGIVEEKPTKPRNQSSNEAQENGDENGDADAPSDEDEIQKPSKRQKVTFEDEEPDPSNDRHLRMSQVKQHLQLLARDTCGFLKKGSDRGQGEFFVDFERIAAHLRDAELDQMILEKFGKFGHRLVRMMRKYGKLEEKHLPNVAFIKQKDIRTKLAEMHMAGVVDIQEVPRDATRSTARTMFLWFFDTERVSAMLLDSLYKCMSRCYQRIDIERRKEEVLELIQREDTRDKPPEEVLDQEGLNKLEIYRNKEELLLTQIGRFDELIGIFRDY